MISTVKSHENGSDLRDLAILKKLGQLGVVR